jgi:hypothetical protein
VGENEIKHVGQWLVLCQSACESNRIVSEFHFEKMRYCDVRRSSFPCALSAKERGQGEGADRFMYVLSHLLECPALSSAACATGGPVVLSVVQYDGVDVAVLQAIADEVQSSVLSHTSRPRRF